MNRLFMMCGIPGIGKSTWVKNRPAEDGRKQICVSRDEIRFAIVREDEEYFSKEDEVFDSFIINIKKAICTNENADIFIDATHLNPKSRERVLKRLGEDVLNQCEVIAVNFPNDEKLAFERNEQRTGRARVPRGIIRRMACCFEPATEEEGFNKIINIEE